MLNSVYPVYMYNNNYAKSVNFKGTDNKESVNSNEKKPKMSDGEKVLIGLGAVAVLTIGGILVNKKIQLNKLNKAINSVKGRIANRVSFYNSVGSDAFFDNKVLQGYIDDAAKLAKKEQLQRLEEIQSVIGSDRGFAQRLPAMDISKLPKDVQDAIRVKDQLKATEAYIKYCDNLFHKSKTAGATVQESVENVFGKDTKIKPHTYDLSKESDRIATSCYTTGGGYTDVTVTSANQIADRLNWKSTISTYTDLGSDLPQNALFSIRKKTVDGKPVVTLVYRDAFRDDVLNGIRLLSPDSKLTPAQRDLLKLKDCKSFPLTDFQTLTSSPGSTNYDAILSTIKTTADGITKKSGTVYDAQDFCSDCVEFAIIAGDIANIF